MSPSTQLLEGGVSVQDDFLPAEELRALRACALLREARGDFAPARIGASGAARRQEAIRGDFTCWLRHPLLPPEQALAERLEEMRLQLNRESFLGLFELELHYAKYPPGAGYARHVDQPQGSAQRKLSMALYLNPDWQPGDGGALRIFGAAAQALDVEPLGGRLVCFLSSGREHEVLPARRERLSVSGWFRAREG
ncbi:MAG TPA: 2OG-Fe(II) oxygenase [Steroidobacteraceae bacterium]|nr:2OG-Fe(II) oxygenase [Steroidobacteraceae bacterium]